MVGALENFMKCLEASQQAKLEEQEAECYQKIGFIYEKQGDLAEAIK